VYVLYCLQESRRLAAVLLLQQRLPVLLNRRRIMQRSRQQLAIWAPWLAHLHTLLGGLAAEACCSIAANRPVGAAGADVSNSSADIGSSSTEGVASSGTAESGNAAVEGQATGAAGEAPDAAAAAENRPGSAGKGSGAAGGGSSSRPGSPPKKTTPRGSRAPTPRGKDGRDKAGSADALLSNEALMQQLGVQVRGLCVSVATFVQICEEKISAAVASKSGL
jgi:hypothetical protein